MHYITIILLIFSTVSSNAQSLIEWNQNNKLSYNNFKKKPTQTKKPQGYLDSKLGWQISETTGEVPQLKVFNSFNETDSWVSMKHEGILKDMQLQFDLSELYARKIRKDFENLKKKKAFDKDSYRNKFNQGISNFQKRLKSIAGVSINQPSLYKILNTQIQDSLKLYNNYIE